MAEQRLIDAESLQKSIRETAWYPFADTCQMTTGASNQTVWYREQDISRCIAIAPTIEAKPIVHAHWDYTGSSVNSFIAVDRCSNCGAEDENGVMYDFCPWCGAQMDEEERLK